MVFLFDLALAAELLALGLGIILLVWAYRTEGVAVGVAKIFGFIIAIIAGLAILCTAYHGVKFMSKAYHSGFGMHKCMMMKKCMMDRKEMMNKNPMMENMKEMEKNHPKS